tara:strand:+ start:38 stop:493 length:456 start_codon:yes stop_codon:yes gene_type:complete
MNKFNTKKIIFDLNKNIKGILILLFIILFFIQSLQTLRNINSILNKNYHERMSQNYLNKFYSGFCKKQSHGYLIYIKNNFIEIFKDNKIPIIINYENRKIPEWIFQKTNLIVDDNYLIILNKNKNIKSINIEDYKVLDNYNNKCFLLKKND